MTARASALRWITASCLFLAITDLAWAAESHADPGQMDQKMDHQEMDHQGVDSQHIGDTDMLLDSDPIDGANLGRAPDALSLTFVHPMRLSLVRLTTIAGEVIPVPLDPKAESAEGVSVPLPPLSSGHYRIEWRAVGDDGHTMSGSLSFSVN